MAERLTVHDKNGNKVYDIVIERDFSNLAGELEKLDGRYGRICIVTETKVDGLYGDSIFSLLEELGAKVFKFVFPAGEENKNLDTVKELYTFLIKNNFDRKDLLIALGGGVVGDLCGYTAATYLRGIDFIQLPTTLLAQSDSSIGGKTGVDFDGYKNMVGAFYQPRLVYMCTDTLKTLTEREYLSGMGEVVKHGLIRDRSFYEWLKENAEAIIERNDDCLIYMAKMNCSIKRAVVEKDFKEAGERAHLNFGHTLGHAIEKFVYKYRLHGECVAVGINGAAYISMKKGMITREEYEDILNTLTRFKLPIHESRIDVEEVLKVTSNDKKMEAGRIKFIVLKELGKADIDNEISLSDMREALYIIVGKEGENGNEQ